MRLRLLCNKISRDFKVSLRVPGLSAVCSLPLTMNLRQPQLTSTKVAASKNCDQIWGLKITSLMKNDRCILKSVYKLGKTRIRFNFYQKLQERGLLLRSQTSTKLGLLHTVVVVANTVPNVFPTLSQAGLIHVNVLYAISPASQVLSTL